MKQPKHRSTARTASPVIRALVALAILASAVCAQDFLTPDQPDDTAYGEVLTEIVDRVRRTHELSDETKANREEVREVDEDQREDSTDGKLEQEEVAEFDGRRRRITDEIDEDLRERTSEALEDKREEGGSDIDWLSWIGLLPLLLRLLR